MEIGVVVHGRGKRWCDSGRGERWWVGLVGEVEGILFYEANLKVMPL